MIISFTGHRSQKIGGFKIPNPTYNYIIQEIEKLLLELKPDKIISGMALGIDTIAAELSIKLNIPFIAAVPFLGQERMWPKQSQDIYFSLLEKAAEIKYICEPGYMSWKMQRRNEWMCNNSDVLIAVYNGDKTGGTANCVNYARQQNKKIIIIDPRG